MKLTIEIEVPEEFVRAIKWYDLTTRGTPQNKRYDREHAKRILRAIMTKAATTYIRKVREMYACYVNLHHEVM